MFRFKICIALVAFDLVSDLVRCEDVNASVGAGGRGTWPDWIYLKGALGWEKWVNLTTTNKARSHKHTHAQASQRLHHGPTYLMPTALQKVINAEPGL